MGYTEKEEKIIFDCLYVYSDSILERVLADVLSGGDGKAQIDIADLIESLLDKHKDDN